MLALFRYLAMSACACRADRVEWLCEGMAEGSGARRRRIAVGNAIREIGRLQKTYGKGHYPADYFVSIELPQAVEQAFAEAA